MLDFSQLLGTAESEQSGSTWGAYLVGKAQTEFPPNGGLATITVPYTFWTSQEDLDTLQKIMFPFIRDQFRDFTEPRRSNDAMPVYFTIHGDVNERWYFHLDYSPLGVKDIPLAVIRRSTWAETVQEPPHQVQKIFLKAPQDIPGAASR